MEVPLGAHCKEIGPTMFFHLEDGILDFYEFNPDKVVVKGSIRKSGDDR